MPEEKLETITFDDQELFDQANADDPIEDQQPEAEIEQPEVKVEADPVKAESEQDEPAPEAIDDDKIPQWRRAEMAEATRQAKKDADEAKQRETAAVARATELERRLQSFEKPVEPKKVDKPDPLIDPDAYEAYIEKKVEDRLLNDRRENSLHAAHQKYGKDFDEAYAAAQQKIDPSLKSLMQNSRDPGETLIKWHREQKLLQEVGTDPNAWREKEAERLLNDPAFLEKAIAKAAGAQQQQPSGGKPNVRLPPSLSGATRATTRPETLSDDDMSDEALWDHVNA